MDEYDLHIRSSLIKPLKRKTSYNNNDQYDKKLKPTFIVRPLPITITRKLQLSYRPPNPVVGNFSVHKGLLGLLRSPYLSWDDKVAVKIVEARAVAGWISEGLHCNKDVVITKGNKVCPSYIPDLALLPLPLKIFVRHMLRKEGGLGGIKVHHIVPKSIMSMIDPPSILPACHESCVLDIGENRITINNYSHDLKLFQTHCGYSLFVVTHESEWWSRISKCHSMYVLIQALKRIQDTLCGTAGTWHVIHFCQLFPSSLK